MQTSKNIKFDILITLCGKFIVKVYNHLYYFLLLLFLFCFKKNIYFLKISRMYGTIVVHFFDPCMCEVIVGRTTFSVCFKTRSRIVYILTYYIFFFLLLLLPLTNLLFEFICQSYVVRHLFH